MYLAPKGMRSKFSQLGSEAISYLLAIDRKFLQLVLGNIEYDCLIIVSCV